MNFNSAVAIRTKQLAGETVDPQLAAMAIEVIKAQGAIEKVREAKPKRKHPDNRKPKVVVQTSAPAPLEVPAFRDWTPGEPASPWALNRPLDEPESPKHWPAHRSAP